MVSKVLRTTLLSAAVATFLVGCGGGSGGSSNNLSLKVANTDINLTADNTNCEQPNPNQIKLTLECSSTSFSVLENTSSKDPIWGTDLSGILKVKNLDIESLKSNTIHASALTTIEFYSDSFAADLTGLGVSNAVPTLNTHLIDLKDTSKVSSEDLAVILSTQYLATELENALQTLSNDSQLSAAQKAYDSILNNLTNTPLFAGGATNTTVLQAILQAAIPASTDATLKSSLITKLTATTQEFYAQVYNNGATTYPDLTQTQLPEYSEITVGGFDLEEILESSPEEPLALDYSTLTDQNLEFALKLDNLPLNMSEVGDIVQADFKVTVDGDKFLQFDTPTIISKFDSNGVLTAASIPEGTRIVVNTNLQGIDNVDFTLDEAIDLDINNGSVSLANLIQSNSKVENVYNRYIDQVGSGSELAIELSVLPLVFNVDEQAGSNVEAFFKLN